MRSTDLTVQNHASSEMTAAIEDTSNVSSRSMIVIGQFPPPVHGFAEATMSMARFLESQGFSVLRIDLKPLIHENGIWRSAKIRITQLLQVFKGVCCGCPVYLALSGGLRQTIDALFLLIARLANVRIYVHHHSFFYVDKRRGLTRICLWLSGRNAIHIVLCPKMGKALKQQYKSVWHAEVVSNAGLLARNSNFRLRPSVQKIGYLGALTKEKGIIEFLNFVKAASTRHPHLSFVIAGPVSNSSIRDQINILCEENTRVEYMGPIYGESKNAFFQSVDALLFPTQYLNEAEPLVIWEAVSYGIPVISWQRGCIEEMLVLPDALSPTVIHQGIPFVDAALARLEKWIQSPQDYHKVASTFHNRFESAASQSLETLKRIFPLNR